MDQLLETEKILKFKETGDSGCIYQKELDETCFQHDMAYGDFKDLLKRTYDKELRGYAFIIGKIQDMMGIKDFFAGLEKLGFLVHESPCS